MNERGATPGDGGPLVVRADAGPVLGAGHVMRCLALVQAWQDRGGRAHFVMAEGAREMAPLLAAERIELDPIGAPRGGALDAERTAAIARESRAAFLVLDGYAFHGDYQRAVRRAGAPTLIVDDNGECAPHDCDVVLNPSAHASQSSYATRAELLLGPRYAPLRRAFRGSPARERRGANVLITLGGGDADNVTLRAIEAVQTIDVDDLAVIAVAGAVNPHEEILRAAVLAAQGRVELRRSEPDMPALMRWADVAVAGAGSTVWELAFSGVPMMCVALAENQRAIAARLAELGAAVHLGWHADVDRQAIASAVRRLLTDPKTRAEMSRRGRALVDGEGAARVIEALLALGRT